ncbi:SusC/RagA family TonB-linked outer membrane protein [Aquimarina sp. AD10]|uniref:SusC/RagA family TonB-linked outer membrane protein n=1 Tax=Aquimarina sp. AD10 TaxID=1714849 RepID=UPI000E4E45E2|nr:SusC/RagA family TonB-linked outer membrane protein [Aquimarina sp. AD10]AXT62684.1 SusC/RagA family TonB-linked outer membrane protein [Aquimarina sp. AD10]RKM98321.1 SusC/RagA family TonB-linked outer membrane protein [Aquimarina sp. AD10]
MKINYYYFFMFLFLNTISFAQEIEVSGTVSSEDGLPLPGATIVVKDTSTGTQTDFDGNFTINTKRGAILVISYLGFKDQEASASSSPLTITLVEDENTLDEVIVTAQGISKSKKSLGYAISKVASEEIEQRPEADVSRTLQGKIAGVQITASSGSTGNAPLIRIRSSLSLTQSNGPLIVINNVPSNASLIDIDPNDIKSVNILKGLNASVLYGSEGRNGVILIETISGSGKLGKKSFKASVSQTTYTNEVANLPEYQNTYGVGNNQQISIGNTGSFGAPFADFDEVPHPLSGNPSFPEFANATVPYKAAPNNVKDFFRTGRGSITSLRIRSTNKTTAVNLSVGYTSEEGIIGNNDLKRFNIGLGGKLRVTDKLKVSTSLNYSSRQRNSQIGSNIFERLHYIPRSLDIHNLPFQDPVTGANVYYRSDDQNPLWVLNNTGRFDDIIRFSGTLNTTYKFTDNLKLSYRVGLDHESEFEFDFSNKGGTLSSSLQNGFLNLSADKEFEVDQSLILNANYKLSKKIGFEGQVGINSNYNTFKVQESDSDSQIVFGFLRPDNFRTTVADFDEIKENLAGVFGQFEFNYDQFLYVTLSGRNDWGSTVEPENRSIFYPGASISFIPTSAFDFNSRSINYLKLRAAYATSSGFPSALRTRTILNLDPLEFVSDTNGNVAVIGVDNELANPDLRPELHKEIEVGMEGSFFNNNVSFEVSAFRRISEDQILEADLDPSTGFDQTLINAGRIDTEGIEIDLGINLFRNKNFRWNLRNVFTAFETTVVDIPSNRIRINDNSFAIEGQPLGVIVENYALRDAEGNLLVNPNDGELIVSDEVGLEDRIIADPTPDWRMSTINTFRYKDFALSAQLEYSHGGENYSEFVKDLLERGVTRDTENREGSFVIPGVLGDPGTGLPLLDANGRTIPNTIQQNAFATVPNYADARDLLVFDNSVFRIREIAFSYTLNKGKSKLPFQSMRLTLSGRNLFYFAPNYPKYTNIDPELDTSGGNVTVPTTKRYAFGVAISF